MTSGPGVVGVGLDLVDVDRFGRALDRRPRLAERVFTDGERADRAPGSLAVRFAAKEAVMKALGTGLGGFALRDVEVLDDGGEVGGPAVRLGGSAAELARRRGVARWHVSLTHAGRIALAVAVAEGA